MHAVPLKKQQKAVLAHCALTTGQNHLGCAVADTLAL
jgi:hypothetical protein